MNNFQKKSLILTEANKKFAMPVMSKPYYERNGAEWNLTIFVDKKDAKKYETKIKPLVDWVGVKNPRPGVSQISVMALRENKIKKAYETAKKLGASESGKDFLFDRDVIESPVKGKADIKKKIGEFVDAVGKGKNISSNDEYALWNKIVGIGRLPNISLDYTDPTEKQYNIDMLFKNLKI